MAVGDLYRCGILGELHGQTLINTVQYKETVSGTGNSSVVLAAALAAMWAPVMKAALSNEYTYEGVSVQNWYPPPTVAATIDTTGAGAGTVAQSSLPTTVAAVCKKKTNLAGPRYRGRIFISGLPITYEADSTLNVTGLAAMSTIAALLDNTIVSSGYTFIPVLVFKASTPPVTTQIFSVAVDPILRVQRRREIGKGV